MDDLINRNVAIDALRAIKHGLWEIDIPSPTVPEYVEHHEQIKNMMEIVDGWIKRIKEEPAADAVPVVRCRDCKFATMTINGECKYCDIWFPNEKTYMDGDYFCASGERREE